MARIFAVIILFAISSAVSGTGVTKMQVLGSTPDNKTYVDEENSNGLVWTEFTRHVSGMNNGSVTRFEFFARAPGVVVLQMWKLVGFTDSHLRNRLIGSMTVRADKPGYHAFDVAKDSLPPVQGLNLIAIYTPGDNIVPFNSLRSKKCGLNFFIRNASSVAMEIGGTEPVPFESIKNFPFKHPCRIYSFRVTVVKGAPLNYSTTDTSPDCCFKRYRQKYLDFSQSGYLEISRGSLDECRRRCCANKYCRSFSTNFHKEGEFMCIFHSTSHASGTKLKYSYGATHYDRCDITERIEIIR